MKMKILLVSIVLAIVVLGCSDNGVYVRNGKHVYREYQPLFDRYTDSVNKYYKINTKCGEELFEYYIKKADSAYKAIYPEGNPSVEADKKFDTVCYPIKK